ncbi:hypothetical protein QFC22_002874 [Naganishia vaughanmartiniae]|uniref:Uncharacterized protein n=1 Tax=Naganishia vaughanmartiniae TaxID=1424756 RepID=A0ACC2XA92_9TREE|nr:hypothetical protein QFC22_002874 [Naganishia vaughanmartiniae]
MRASKTQETFDKLVLTHRNNDDERGLGSKQDQQNYKSGGHLSPPASPSREQEQEQEREQEYSPPRFLHHLAPDLENDLVASRRAAVGPFSPLLDSEEDSLNLFPTPGSTSAFGASSGAEGGGTNKLQVRKRMSNPLLGEPYYPNPNPVKGWTVGRERERERRKANVAVGLGVFAEVGLLVLLKLG